MKETIFGFFSSLLKAGVATVIGIISVILIATILLTLIEIFIPKDAPTVFPVPTSVQMLFLLAGLLVMFITPWLGGLFSNYTLNILGERKVILSIIIAFIVGAIAGNIFRIGIPYLGSSGNPTIPGPPPLEVQLQLNKILRTSMANGIPSAFLVGLQRTFSPYVLKELELMKELKLKELEE